MSDEVLSVTISPGDNGKGDCLWAGTSDHELAVMAGKRSFALHLEPYSQSIPEAETGVCLARLWPKGEVDGQPRTCARCGNTFNMIPV